MSIIRKFKSVLGKSKTNETTATSDTVEAIISDIAEHNPLAISNQNVLYAGLNELGGYFFFQTVIVGTFKVKTKKGGQLNIAGENIALHLESDSVEFESDPTDVKGRWITKIDFQIEKEDAAKILKPQLDKLILTSENQDISFTIYESEEEE